MGDVRGEATGRSQNLRSGGGRRRQKQPEAEKAAQKRRRSGTEASKKRQGSRRSRSSERIAAVCRVVRRRSRGAQGRPRPYEHARQWPRSGSARGPRGGGGIAGTGSCGLWQNGPLSTRQPHRTPLSSGWRVRSSTRLPQPHVVFRVLNHVKTRRHHSRGSQDQAEATGQDPVAALPHRRRRLAHPP